MASLYELMETIIGVPQNDSQSFMLYMMACILGCMFVLLIFWLFKIIAGLSKDW